MQQATTTDDECRVLLEDDNNKIVEAPFHCSVFRFFNLSSNVFCFGTNVAIDNYSKRVILRQPTNSYQVAFSHNHTIYENIPLGRSLQCPLYEFHLLTDDHKQRVIQELNNKRVLNQRPLLKHCALAVSVLIENRSTGKVLITRRAKHMRSFPSVWVTPGGGVDHSDENLFASAQREVFEETGLNVDPQNLQLYCMWESVFPNQLHLGNPTHHHLILYYRAFIDLEREEEVNMQLEEVDAFAWLDINHVRQALFADQATANATFSAYELTNDQPQSVQKNELDIARLHHEISKLERLSEATEFLLTRWYNDHRLNANN